MAGPGDRSVGIKRKVLGVIRYYCDGCDKGEGDMTNRTMTTWRAADPSELILEHEFITSLDGLDEWDDPVELIEEVWELVSRRRVRVGPVCRALGCAEEATHWGLCEAHAREDDPEAFEEPEERTSE